MMSAFILILFPLLSGGVFGDDVVTVMEGDSVTLHVDTKIQIKEIDWRFGENLIASIDIETSDISFEGPSKDRLKLDNQTGDLTITHISISDAGSYNLQVNSEELLSKKFTLRVVSVDKMPSVLMGEFVTLHTGVFEPEKYAVIRWRFGDQKSPIAEVNRATGNISTYDNVADGSFKKRLQLDYWTGSLTITNTKPTDSGKYEVDIISSSRETIHKSFSVTVRGEIQVSVMEGESISLSTDVTELLKYDSVLWMFGDTLIVTIQNNINDGLDGRFRDRMKLDHQTGSLTITNTRNTDSGVYTLQISSSKQIIHKKFNVRVIDPGLSAGAVAGIVLAVLLACAVTPAVAAAVIYHHRKISELKVKARIDEVRRVSVIEGEPITLNPDEEHKDDKLVWTFAGFGIAEMKISDHRFIVHNDVLDGRFRDRLELDHHTGSLTITNTTNTDSGIYELWITRLENISIKRFRVSVFDQTHDIQTVSVKKGESLELKTGVDDIQTFEEIQWRFGLDIFLAETRGGTKYISPFQDRVEMNDQTGSLTIQNSRHTDAGVYMLSKIEGGNFTTILFRVEVESTDNRNNPEEESVRRNNPENVPLMRRGVP